MGACMGFPKKGGKIAFSFSFEVIPWNPDHLEAQGFT